MPPAEPAGKVNTTDPDSKNVKGFRGYVQGYNAQAVVTEQQIVIAAEVNIDPQDFGHLGPMIAAAQARTPGRRCHDQPGVVLADAGYWHFQQMDELAAQGIPVLIPPDSTKRKTAAAGVGRRSLQPGCGDYSPPSLGRELYQQTSPDDRAGVRADQIQPADRPVPTKRPDRGAL